MSKVILTVDASLSDNQSISFILTGSGYNVIEATSREDAFDILNTEKIDLIIADLNTLNSGGLSFVCDIHNLPGYINIPIIVLTAESRFFNKSLYNNCGVTDWITKPFLPDKLVSIVSKSLPSD